MTQQIPLELVTGEIFPLLEETFAQVHGIYCSC
jgi:hypothetical protein